MRAADQDRARQALVRHDLDRAQHALLLALGIDDALGGLARTLEDGLHGEARAEGELGEALAIGLEIDDRARGDPARHRRLGDGGRQLDDKARVEGTRDEIVGPEAGMLAAIGLDHHLGGLHARELGEGFHAGELHRLVDGGGPHVEGAAEDEGEAEHVVDLVGVVRAAGRDHRIGPGGAREIGEYLGVGIGECEDERLRRHALDHLPAQDGRRRQAEEDVGSLDHLLELARGGRPGVGLLARVHLLATALVDHAQAVDEDDVLALEPHAHEQIETGEPGGTAPRRDHLDLLDILADDAQAVLDRGTHDDGGPVLVVVEDRDLHARAQRFLDLEALRRLDVLEIDGAEGGLEPCHRLDELLGIGLVDLDVEDVDAGEFLEENGLALHHRLGGKRPDRAEAEHGGAVRDHADEIGPGGEPRGFDRVGHDGIAGSRHPRRIGQRQVALVGERLGRHDAELSRRIRAMVLEGCFLEIVGHGRVLEMPRFCGTPVLGGQAS